MVNVTKENFVEQSNDLIQHLPTAAFIAIDEEMTGISIPGAGRPTKDQSPSQRYPILKQAPERYGIIQWGVCLFHRRSPRQQDNGSNTDSWQVRRYNFYMFPADMPYKNNNSDQKSQHNDSINTNNEDHAPREIVLNPGAVAFLNQHGMSFDTWTKLGVPYQNVTQAAATLEHYIATQRKEREAAELSGSNGSSGTPPPTVQETVRRRVELRRTEDINFYARAMASLREWLDAAHAPTEGQPAEAVDFSVVAAEASGRTFLLPACNSFMRRALYESIGKEYPSLDLENAGPDYPNQIRVWRLSPAERLLRQKRLRQEAWHIMISGKVGMYRVFEAIARVARGEMLPTDSVLFASSYEAINWDAPGGILRVNDEAAATQRSMPIVVHNGFMDICFLLTHFHSRHLPSSLPECKNLIRGYFPTVFDTKILSTEYCSIWESDFSDLSSLYNALVLQPEGEVTSLLENLYIMEPVSGCLRVVARRADDYITRPDQEHEAAYDAYMTGCVFLRICNHIKDQNPDIYEDARSHAIVGDLTHPLLNAQGLDVPARRKFGRNKLYQMSIFTMDLENSREDPLSYGMTPETTFRVEGIDPSVSTKDIVRCLTGMRDRDGRRVNFDIIWVNDSTFLVAASYRAPLNPPQEQETEEGEIPYEPPQDEGASPETVLEDHGRMIYGVLQGRFASARIITLREHLDSLGFGSAEKQERGSFLDRVWQLFGIGRKRRSPEASEMEPAQKRTRIR